MSMTPHRCAPCKGCLVDGLEWRAQAALVGLVRVRHVVHNVAHESPVPGVNADPRILGIAGQINPAATHRWGDGLAVEIVQRLTEHVGGHWTISIRAVEVARTDLTVRDLMGAPEMQEVS